MEPCHIVIFCKHGMLDTFNVQKMRYRVVAISHQLYLSLVNAGSSKTLRIYEDVTKVYENLQLADFVAELVENDSNEAESKCFDILTSILSLLIGAKY